MIAYFIFAILWAESVRGSVPFFNYVGRFDRSLASSLISQNWPRTGIEFSVKADGAEQLLLSIQFNVSSLPQFYVSLENDCEFIEKYSISESQSLVVVAFDKSVANAIHEFRVLKITEALCGSDAQGEMQILSIAVSGGELVDVTNEPTFKSCYSNNSFKLLTIGDSITAAYGVDGVYPCKYSASTQNILHSYAHLVATSLGADLQVVAWSGKGVVRNYGDSYQMSSDPMPMFYNRTIATRYTGIDDYWRPNRYVADVVLVMLGKLVLWQ